jgi:predicted PolB exonuclease-like 3'-5' exonuclease
MDVLSGYQSRGRAGLEAVSQLLSLPGKLGIGGGQVWDAFRAGEIDSIRQYCEIDVLNTFLIYLRFELIRGRLSTLQYEDEVARVRAYLAEQQRPHFAAYLAAWPA